MSALEDREKGFERKFAADQELEFRAQSRGNRMLAEWAGKRMDLENVEDYVRAVVRAELGTGGEDDVVRKVAQDLAAAGLHVRDSEVRTKADEFLAVAREQVKAGK
ncbi:MAG TPA: DUF1476 domain-containing protein [Caulobacteraceae bacterium]|nr:DUF1476 domain-containing protein [Caulobacteraceae bacterium]